MVVGDQHLQTQGLRRLHARHTGYAVVHCNQDIGPLRMNPLGNGRGQAVTIDHAVGHQISHIFGPQHAQAAHRHGTGGGAIAVVIGHHTQALVLPYGIGQQLRRLLCAQHARRGQQKVQGIVQFVFGQNAPGRIQAGQQRVNARLFQRPGAAGRYISGQQIHGVSKASRAVKGVVLLKMRATR